MSITHKPTAHREDLAVAIGRNTIFGIVAKIAQIGTRLVTVPIVIGHLGLDGYGIWSIIMTTAAYMRFGSVGIKSAFQKYVAESFGSGQHDTANKLLSTGCALMLVLSVAGLIPVALFSKQLAAAAGIPPAFLYDAQRAISVLALIMVLSNVGAAYEAILMGAQRIDLARNFTTVFTILEAVAIVALLYRGFGLFAMAVVMAASEIGFVACCYVAAKRIAPGIEVKREHVTASVLGELIRFGGSYQLINVLEILYASILPIALLKNFGASAAGIYTVTLRIVTSALMFADSLLIPILSGGAMVYASGSVEDMERVISKAFKVTAGLSLFPLAFISLFGAKLVLVWTGEANPEFGTAIWLVAASGFFYELSLLELVLYRTSGKASMDNIRQVIRIVTLLLIARFAQMLGFHGVLSGLMLAEAIGMLFMLVAIKRTFQAVHLGHLARDAARLIAATGGILAVAVLASHLQVPVSGGTRIAAVVQLAVVGAACVVFAGPLLWAAGVVTPAEGRTLLQMFRRRRRLSAPVVGEAAS